MRILFLFLFFICLVCGKASAQLGVHPLVGIPNGASNARTEALTTSFVDTLKLPHLHDFASKYLSIDHIVSPGTSINVYSIRPHGLVDGDTIDLSGAATGILGLSGYKFAKKITDYQFQIYDDKALSTATTNSATTIPYVRISKRGAKETVTPDTLTFYNNHGGVKITGGSAKNQPGYFVASFDGLNENGSAYSLSSSAVGYTDSLTSQPLNLKYHYVGATKVNYVLTDTIGMSFHYQHGGLGEEPDAGDHLYLEFLDSTKTWHVVKDLTGTNAGNKDSFHVAMIPIDDAKYFHKSFKYRFRSYGRQSGLYDVWNIDNIYIDTNRTISDSIINDFAIRNGDASFLKNYTAMPFDHFFPAIPTHAKTSLQFTATNQLQFLDSRVPKLTLVNHLKDTIVSIIPTGTDLGTQKDTTYTFNISTYNFPALTLNKPTYIDQIYGLKDEQATDYDPPSPFDVMHNNFISRRTYLYDYYAYDDSEAEAAFGTNQAGSQLAMQFVSEATDMLTHISICFAHSKGPNQEGSQIYLKVWKDTLSNSVVEQPINIHYQNYLNGFYSYELSSPISLNAGQKYFIGYKQNLSSLLTLGYDRNNDSRTKMFYNESNSWASIDSNLADAGTMMIRPVFFKAGSNIPSGVLHPEADKSGLLLYPNPATNTIDIIATDKLKDLNYTIYSLYGQVVANGLLTSTEHTINVSYLSTGMYLVLCTDAEGKIYTTRFIKE
jgi:hypothetical protein